MLIEVEIAKVINGYIVTKRKFGEEIKVFTDFLEVLDWIALTFNENAIREKIRKMKKEELSEGENAPNLI